VIDAMEGTGLFFRSANETANAARQPRSSQKHICWGSAPVRTGLKSVAIARNTSGPVLLLFTPAGVLITMLPVSSCFKWFARVFPLLQFAPITTIALGAGFVNTQPPLAQRRSVQSLNRGIGLAVTGHFDKSKTS